MILWRGAITLANNQCIDLSDLARSTPGNDQVVEAALRCSDGIRSLLPAPPQAFERLPLDHQEEVPVKHQAITSRDRWVWHQAITMAMAVCEQQATEARQASDVTLTASTATACSIRIQGYLTIDQKMGVSLIELLTGQSSIGTSRYRRLAYRLSHQRMTTAIPEGAAGATLACC